MQPPADTAVGLTGPGADGRAGAATILRLRYRADFLRAAQSRRHGTPGFTLQARMRGESEAEGAAIRLGFTCSKKLGNAVTRNRAKRRLRALAREVVPSQGRAGWDYVLVGRPGATVALPFAAMLGDLERAMERVHRAVPAGPRQPGP
ncbi:MAG: ribonuclease P protein component [Paracoccaceae bacterium]